MTAADGDDRPDEDESPHTDSESNRPSDDNGQREGTQELDTQESDGETQEGEDETQDSDNETQVSDSERQDSDDDVQSDGGEVASGAELPEGDETGFAGAPDDQEMPLTDHIEEMLARLLAVIVVMAIISLITFPFADRLINTLWYSFLPSPEAGIEACGNVPEDDVDACPRLYHPLSLLLARLKVASLAGFIIALPVFVYQTYLFMRPGLYPNERKYYLAAVPTSLILALVGVAFAYLLILPILFNYFLFYSEDVADIAFALDETFNMIILMMGLFAIIFQIPLFIMLAIMMGVTTREWLADKRILFWFAFAGIAFLFSPDPTGMAPIMVAATMIVLFEMTLLLLRWTGR